MPSDLSRVWSASRNSTLTTEINRLRTTPISQDLVLGRGGNNEAYCNKFWGKFGCDAIRVVSTTRRHGRLKISASTSSAGQRSSTPKPGQTTNDKRRHPTNGYDTRHSNSTIHSFRWIEHKIHRQVAQQQNNIRTRKQSDPQNSV
jgi:hypothetical protein